MLRDGREYSKQRTPKQPLKTKQNLAFWSKRKDANVATGCRTKEEVTEVEMRLEK